MGTAVPQAQHEHCDFFLEEHSFGGHSIPISVPHTILHSFVIRLPVLRLLLGLEPATCVFSR